MEHRVALLVVVGSAPYPDLAQSFVATYTRIDAFLTKHGPPFIAKVYRPAQAEVARNPSTPGRIELWYPRSGERQ